MSINVFQPVLHWVTSHIPYRKWCEQNHPEVNSARCALIYSFFKRHDDYDKVLDGGHYRGTHLDLT